jgi:hypothetical protein
VCARWRNGCRAGAVSKAHRLNEQACFHSFCARGSADGVAARTTRTVQHGCRRRRDHDQARRGNARVAARSGHLGGHPVRPRRAWVDVPMARGRLAYSDGGRPLRGRLVARHPRRTRGHRVATEAERTSRGVLDGSVVEAEGPGFEPGRRLTPPNGFQDRRIQPLCHPSAAPQMLRARAAPAATLDAVSRLAPCQTPRRGGREAEGTRLLSEYGGQTPSRVRIPPSPFLEVCRVLRAVARRARP